MEPIEEMHKRVLVLEKQNKIFIEALNNVIEEHTLAPDLPLSSYGLKLIREALK